MIKQPQTNRIFITVQNDDCVYFGIIYDIDIHWPKQSKKATISINEANAEISNLIGAVVIDIHQRTQIEKPLFDNFFHCNFHCSILKKTTFSVCVASCISITTAPTTVESSLFDSLILLDCF